MVGQKTLQAWWWHRQALDGRLFGMSPAEILAKTGWARSVGGAGPYLSLFSRGRTSRGEIDRALETLDIHELPSARGCTYVVPAEDFALALRVGQPFNKPQMATARKLGVTDQEMDELCSAVLEALEGGPLGPAELREATGGAVRSLGQEGKKKGLTTTLPVALGQLQAYGEIRRIPTNGRLDQQRYQYARWQPNPLDGFSLGHEEANEELARRYFAWTAPATLDEFRWFSGLGVGASKAAVEPLGLVSLDEDRNDPRLLFAHQKEALLAFQASADPHYQLISSLDALFLLRRDVNGLLNDAIKGQKVLSGKVFQAVGGLTDLPSHAIVDRGCLVGLWEYDVETQTVAWMSFEAPDDALRQAVAHMEAFVRSDLGDARSFSLDSPASRAPRIEALRSHDPTGSRPER